MNSSLSLSDPGALLGKTVVKIGLVLLILLLLGCGYMAYLASAGFFSGWDVEFDSDLAGLIPGHDTDSILVYFFCILCVKVSLLLAFLFWLGRKI